MLTIEGIHKPFYDAAIYEIERLLSIPHDYLVLKVLELEHYSDLINFLPWDKRCQVAVVMLTDVQVYGKGLMDVCQID